MAEVAVKFTGDPAAMRRALDAVIRNQERMEQGFRRIKGESKSAGDGMFSNLRAVALELFSVYKGVELVTAAFTEMRKVESEAGRVLSQEAFGTRTLAQIASTTKEFERLKGQVDALEGGMGMKNAAAQSLVFAGAKAGLSDADLRAFAETAKIGADPTAMVESAVRIRGAFGGDVSRRDINTFLAAASGTLAKPEDVGTTFAGASQQFRGAGGTAAAGLALTGEMSKVLKTERATAGMLKALSDALTQHKAALPPEMELLSPMQQAVRISELADKGQLFKDAEKFDPKHPRRLLKREAVDLEEFAGPEGATAIRFVKDHYADILKRKGDVLRAERGTGASDAFAGRLGIVGGDTGLAAELGARQAAETLENMRVEKYAAVQKIAEEIRTRMTAARERANTRGEYDRFELWMREQFSDFNMWTLGPESFARSAVGRATPPAGLTPEQGAEYMQLHDRFESATENLNDAAHVMRGGPTMAPDPRSEK